MTGWLPEFYYTSDMEIDPETMWQKIYNGNKNGDCLITISTDDFEDEDSLGLVGNHAYGVLEVFEYHGLRMLLVKNPWGHFGWKGKYSFGDAAWTPELR